jgi:tetratricopeptide (TPR) repeat protein
MKFSGKSACRLQIGKHASLQNWKLQAPLAYLPTGVLATCSWRMAFLFLALLLAGCAGRKSVILEKPQPTVTASQASTLREEADKLWKQRDNPPKARQALEAYKHAFAADPTNVELGTRLSRAYHFVGYYVETNPEARDTLFLRGVEAGEHTLALNPNFRAVYRKTKDVGRALANIDPRWMNAVFWTGANLDQWSSRRGKFVKLGNKRRIEDYYTKVREHDPNFFYGAVYRFFGTLPTRVPFGDMDESKRQFDKALEVAPNFFGNHRAYAEYYAIKRKDRELFKKLLETASNGDPEVLPDVAPENKYEQAMARKMLANIEAYFGEKKKK